MARHSIMPLAGCLVMSNFKKSSIYCCFCDVSMRFTQLKSLCSNHLHQTRGRPVQPARFMVAMRDLHLVQGRTKPKVVTWMNMDSHVPGGRMRLGLGTGTSAHLPNGHLDAGVWVRTFRSVPSMSQVHLRSGWDRQATACSH